jgi:cholesterol oxidase
MTQKLGLKFSEVMTGGFAMGVSDPTAGEEQGNREGSTVALHCAITVDDLDSFVQDPQHAGVLSGSIDIPPLGTALACDHGVFNLFQPGGASGEKWMVYEAGFSAKSRSYYLAGKKVIKPGHGTDVLAETTTLYTVLYDGSDSSGAVAGAGILHLGVKSIAELARNIRIINAQNSFEVVQGLSMYLKLFLGELWHTYF